MITNDAIQTKAQETLTGRPELAAEPISIRWTGLLDEKAYELEFT